MDSRQEELNNQVEQTRVVEALAKHSDLLKALTTTKRLKIEILDNFNWSACAEGTIDLDDELKVMVQQRVVKEILDLTAYLSNLRGMAEMITCQDEEPQNG